MVVAVVVSVCSRLVSLFVVDPSPWIVGVRISFKKLRSFTRKPLKRAQQPRLRQRRLVLLHVIEPLLRVIRLSVIREPRSAFRVMNRLLLSLPLVRLVPLDQEIPLVINFTNQRVVRNPLKSVQERARLGVDHAQIHSLVRRVSTVVQNHRRPVLPRVRLLRFTGVAVISRPSF